MRLKSEIWVAAYLRRCAGEGAFAVLVRRGAEEAGAIYIKVSLLDGTAKLFAPAPAGFEMAAVERQWVPHFQSGTGDERDADAVIAQQYEYDPDIWVIEVEDRAGRHFLDDWLVAG